MNENIQKLSEKLQREGEKTLQIFHALDESQWLHEVYTDGDTWAIKDVLAHMVTAERAFLRLFKNILAGGFGAAEDFSIDRYNASQVEKMKGESVQGLQDAYQAARDEMIAWVGTLNDGDLEISGRHPFLGQTTLLEMIKMVYLHNTLHVRDLRHAK